MRDETRNGQNAKAHTDRAGRTEPDCCGAMVEHIFNVFRGTAESAGNGEAARDSGTEWFRSCASTMERLASSCCSRGPHGSSSSS